jgi:hypothetical protein
MANAVTINRPEVVVLIEEAAQRLTGGNKTEAVALALRQRRTISLRCRHLSFSLPRHRVERDRSQQTRRERERTLRNRSALALIAARPIDAPEFRGPTSVVGGTAG